MARIRTVKPEFWTSEQVADCSPTARLLFIGMWNFCDDGGNHPASIKQLKMEVFPSDDILLAQIKGMIDELVNNGLIAQYTVNNKDYWHVLGWKHQKIEKPNYKHPPYNDTNSRPVADQSPNDSRPVADQSPNDSRPFSPVMESNGMESNGMESNSNVAEEKKEIANEKPKSKMYVPDSRRTFEITADWKPEPTSWAAYLKISSHLVKPEQFTDYTLAEFVRSNFGSNAKTETDWQKFYVNAIARGYIKPKIESPTTEANCYQEQNTPYVIPNLLKIEPLKRPSPEEKARQLEEVRKMREEM